MSAFIVSLFVCIAVFFLVLALLLSLNKNRNEMRERIKTFMVQAERDRERPKLSFSLRDSGRILARVGKVFSERGLISKNLERELVRADIPLKAGEYLALWLFSVVVPGSFYMLLKREPLGGMCVYLLGILFPPLLIRISYNRRLKRITQQICDALTVISNALRAGYSFQQCLELVSKEMTEPIAKEFSRTTREIRLGTSLEEALQNLGSRVGSEDLNLIITAVHIQRQVGGNLAEILDNISETIRERIRIQREIKTLTAQGKISGLIIGLIPVALIVFISLLSPGYFVPLYTTSTGLLMLLTAVIMEILGIYLINRIINIDV